jgi:tRNA A-37 threonylcarbamoyl transferase component Bud32/tetratricopeptide (TPR) repeat protein
MGSVYLAKDPELQRDVAIKLLHRTTAGQALARERFRDEARALARMSHPNIVTIFEIGEHERQQFIAMEYLQGRSLRELLTTPGSCPPRDRLVAICGEVARAVAAAHGRGILHRDIKPENVVVGETVKVVDFGLARRLGVVTLPTAGVTRANLEEVAFDQTVKMLVEAEQHTATALATLRAGHNATQATESPSSPQPTVAGTLYGTPAYMAPEILEGAPASEASDVYSLGVMLYECLGGRRPYVANTLVELIATVIDGSEPPPPLSDPLAALVASMLSRDPGVRPGLPVIAERLLGKPPVAPVTRRRWPVVAGAGVLALGAAGVAMLVHEPAPAPVVARIVVEPIEGEVRTWSSQQNMSTLFGMVLAKLVARDNLSTTSRPGIPSREIAAEIRATHVVRGRIDQRGNQVLGTIEILDAGGRFAIAFPVQGEVQRVPYLLAEAADRITMWIDPAASPGRRDPMRAAPLLELGRADLMRGNWYDARVYLEQAVQVDPDSAEGWRQLASARGWTIAPRELMQDAIANSIRLERDPHKRQIWIGAAHFYRDEQPQAIEILSAVDAGRLTPTETVDLWNYLGEAYWHDGSPALAMPYFRKLLERKYLPVRVHAYDWGLYHKDFDLAASLYGIERPRQEIELARGDLERLAAGSDAPYNLQAQLILGRQPDPKLVANLRGRPRQFFDLASADASGARRAFGAIYRELVATETPKIWQDLSLLADIVLAAELRDETRQILALQRQRGYQPFRGYHRTEILAAGILGEPKQLSRAGLTSREAKLATAIEAELAGDHARAIEILTPIVAEPTSGWEYPERGALIRNLVAARRMPELRAACAALRNPAIFRYAWLPLARTCKQHVRAR